MSQGCTPEFFIMYFVSKVDKPGDLLQNSQEHFPPAEVYFKWRQADGITGELLLQSQLYLLFCNSDFKTSDISCLCPSLSTPSYNNTQQKREQYIMPQNHGAQLLVYLHLLTVLHGTVNGVASTTNDITLGPTPQQSFDGLRASQTAGHVERRLPVIVQLIYPRAQPRTHDLSEDRMA